MSIGHVYYPSGIHSLSFLHRLHPPPPASTLLYPPPPPGHGFPSRATCPYRAIPRLPATSLTLVHE
jgi:hypothetical protein